MSRSSFERMENRRRRRHWLAPVLVASTASGCAPSPDPITPALVHCDELARGHFASMPQGPKATVIRTKADLDRATAPDESTDAIERGLRNTAGGRVAVVVDMGYNAGSELRPVVDGVEPSPRRVHARWEPNPDGAATDDVTHEWVLVHCPASVVGAATDLPVVVTIPQATPAP